jgi:hypothetical protein
MSITIVEGVEVVERVEESSSSMMPCHQLSVLLRGQQLFYDGGNGLPICFSGQLF